MYGLTATRFSAALAAAAMLAGPVWAQETGVVGGRVTLVENGGPVHGAVIVVVGAGALGLTDEQGGFEIDNVPAGSYEVIAQREHLTADRRMVTVHGRRDGDRGLRARPVRGPRGVDRDRLGRRG